MDIHEEKPIPEIRTCGISSLDDMIIKFEPALIISICGEDHDVSRADRILEMHKDTPVLRLRFHDVDFIPADRTTIAPSLGMIEEALAKIDQMFPDRPPEMILAHCSMGISRSTAMALVASAHVAKTFYSDFDADTWARDQVAELYETNIFAAPNRRVLRIGASLLGDVGKCVLKEVVERS